MLGPSPNIQKRCPSDAIAEPSASATARDSRHIRVHHMGEHGTIHPEPPVSLAFALYEDDPTAADLMPLMGLSNPVTQELLAS
jgi:hypothetical protein